ncbi:MAG: ABC transporter substrate-binding protein [Microbacteriaceae bacterium]
MKHKLAASLAIAAASAMLVAGCSTGGEAPTTTPTDTTAPPRETVELTVATTAATFGIKEDVAIYAVGIQMGYYEEEGIKLNLVNADGSGTALQAVAAGSADISTPDAGTILASVEKGLPVAAIGGLVQNWPWRIAVPKDSPIKSGADLKGKKIGVISLASGSAPYARAFVDGNGLNPETDVTLLPVGIGAQAAGALSSGEVDALALFTTEYVAIEQGGISYDYLDNPASMKGLRSLTFITSKDKLAKDKDVFERFLRASYKALVFSYTNPKAAVEMGFKQYPQLSPNAKIEADIATIKDWISTATPVGVTDMSTVKNWGEIPAADWDVTQKFSMGAGQIKAPIDVSKFWDPSLLKEANNFDAAAVKKAAEDFKG